MRTAKENKTVQLPRGLSAKYAGQKPYYEVWYGKIDISPGRAFWFRYTLLNGVTDEACTWAIVFDQKKIVTGKDIFPLSRLSFPDRGSTLHHNSIKGKDGLQVLQLGSNRLDYGHAIGSAGQVSWNFGFEDLKKTFEHIPGIMQVLKIAKSTYTSCILDARFSGQICFHKKEVRFSKAKGMIGHIYGTRQAHEWAWSHCNSFQNAEGVVFEGITAKVRLGSVMSPPLSSFVVFIGDRCYPFSSIWRLARAPSIYTGGAWDFNTSCNGVKLEGQVRAPSADKSAVVEYTDTDGSSLWCHNSKLSELKLRLCDPQHNLDREFYAKDTAAFEIVVRTPPQKKPDL
ncbi:MAG: hypothetical protein HQM16_12695 [Deltaproteobacteria bacterium]|nr:hypothetical protein [Deltaproteobacteria bacterium]